jgi:hypothetical protein
MQFLINSDSFTELTTPLRPFQSPRLIPWGWIMLSIGAHVLVLLILIKFATTPEISKSLNTASKQRPIIAAKLLTHARIIPKINTLAVSPTITPRKAEALPVEPIPADTAPADTVQTASPPPQVASLVPQQDTQDIVSEVPHTFSFAEAEPVIFSSSQSRLLSNTTTRAEVQAFFNTFNSAETQEDAQQGANHFAAAQISPELFAGAPVLTPAQQDAKKIYDAKIDVDCSSGVNKVLATISQFTLHAVVCQNKGNIDAFIQHRLAGKDSKERLQGLKPRKQRRD